MTLTHMQPEVWAANLLLTLDKSLVFAGAPCSNRDYEGDISAFGDTVHIEQIGDPTITAYTKDTNLSDPEALTDAEQLLLIDQQNSFNFAVDDIDKAQVRNAGQTMKEATRRAGFGLRDKADQLAAARMAAAATNGLGVIDASTTATNVYDQVLVPASVALDQVNVPEELRWIVLPPAAYGKLQLDSRFIKQNEAGTDQGLRNGVVGEAAGFKIFKSNNSPTGATHVVADGATTSGNKNLTSASGSFRQSDIGSVVTGTGIAASTKIVTVTADGTAATTDTNSTATGTAIALTIAAGSNKLVIAGSQIAHSFAQQILEVEGYRPEKRFGDALKGLHVFGTKVVRPQALVVASVKTS
jgi:hypothetical protein